MRYPVLEPFDSGVLEAGGGHQVSWERVGNPFGEPAVVLQSGCQLSPWRAEDGGLMSTTASDAKRCSDAEFVPQRADECTGR